ncbi:MAG: hypothetical protein HDR88_07300 [Bacteroides sp.]|nr:hypothetical protein [Bacteroides sp.]
MTVIISVIILFANRIMAQECMSDTMGLEKELEELVVIAPESTGFGANTIYYPSAELKNVTGNCTQLLSGLSISGLIVNPATGNISLAGKSRLLIKINDKPASERDLTSISSKDVIKVELITTPGIRYGDVDAILEIKVSRRLAGYGMMCNLLQSVNRGWGNYSVSIKYNIGKSEWSLDYNSNPMWDMDCYRDNTEHIVMPDGGVVNRYESGINTPNRMVTHHGSLQYSYAKGNEILFNVQARLIRKNDKYAAKGFVTTETDENTITGYETETAETEAWQGDIDVYFHYKINKRHKIFFNLVPTIIAGSDSRYYESPETAIVSDIDHRSYHLLAEGAWESKIGAGLLSAGINGKTGWNKAMYNTYDQVIREKESDGFLFCEWKQTLGKIQYSAGVRGTLSTIWQPVNSVSGYVNPRLWLGYRPFHNISMSVLINSSTVSPSINQLNPVAQRIDNYQFMIGNTDLKSYRKFEGRIECDGIFKNIHAKLSITNLYSRNPVMSAKVYKTYGIVGTYFNAGFNNDFEIKGMVRMPVVIRQLTLSLEGGWHKYVSSGLNYRHSYSQPFVNAQLMGMIGQWWIMIRYNNTYNQLWGEMVSTINQNLFNIGVGYTYRDATFMAGMVNPFGNVALYTKDLSDKATSDRTYVVSGSRKLIWVGVTMNLYKGKRKVSTQRKLNNQIIYESLKNQMK